jgi:membrane-associated phospholipid phosphatase
MAMTNRRYDRRSLLQWGLGGLALWPLRPVGALATPIAPASGPGPWQTWLLSAGDELRPVPPPAPTAAEVAELRDLQSKRTTATDAIAARWADQPAVLPWTNLILDLIQTHKPNSPRAARILALFHVAIYDTVVATYAARETVNRPTPAAMDPAIVPFGNADPEESTFPSQHAAVAAAAGLVLAELFPDEPADRLASLVDEAAESRLWAGASFRSDVDAGLAIGRAVGELAVARAHNDGEDAVWDGDRPTTAGTWQPTPPAFIDPPTSPLAGTWRPWVLDRGDQFRPAPPPPYQSPSWQAELAAVQEAVARRTPEQEAAALFWAADPGTVTAAGQWIEIARDLIVRDDLDLPHAARVLALTSVAMADGFICCWDAKYAYWTVRPITVDPNLNVSFPTPPNPSFTSGHATISVAAATILGHLFPADEENLAARAIEATNSRLWAGVHFPIDNDTGALGGGLVGRLVVGRARRDGAE